MPGRIFLNFIWVTFIVFALVIARWHYLQPVRAPIAGVTEDLKYDDPERKIPEKEFSPDSAYVDWDESKLSMENQEHYLVIKLVYVPWLLERRVYLYEDFPSYFCNRTDYEKCFNNIAENIRNYGEGAQRKWISDPTARIKRFYLSWDLDGTYRNTGYWGFK